MSVLLGNIRKKLIAQQAAAFVKFSVRSDPAPLVASMLAVLFPQFRGSAALEEQNLYELKRCIAQMVSALAIVVPDVVVDTVLEALPEIQARLLVDAAAILEGDPAARSLDEVIIAYPGFYAIAIFRCAHAFHLAGVPILPRVLTEFAHEKTGIDIHPGATIGEGFCIDHGTGIVVGETTIVGTRVKLYQGVTLGALSVEKSAADTKRHPTVEDNVVLYSNATVLGGNTVIGHDSVIGGNVWITESVAPHSVIYHKAETTLRSNRI